jgi:hypothetical protein
MTKMASMYPHKILAVSFCIIYIVRAER